GCPACPHPGKGPAIAGSPNVFVNGRPAVRVKDAGIHKACCGPNMWTAMTGSNTVFINGRPAHRRGDKTLHCGGLGRMAQGSGTLFVGDSTSAGRSGSPQPSLLSGSPPTAAAPGDAIVLRVGTPLQPSPPRATWWVDGALRPERGDTLVLQ